MSESTELTISATERAELETLLDLCLAEIERDKGQHEQFMDRVDQNISETKRLLTIIRANLETPCGKS